MPSLLDLFVNVRATGVGTVSGELAGIDAQARKTDKAFGSSMKSIGSSMTRIGGVMSLAVTAPIVAAGVAIVKMGADYDQSLTNAVSVTGKTGAAADKAKEQMNQLALQLGAKTAFSAKDAADAMYDLASSGWDVNQMQKGLNGIMNLATATQTDLADATGAVVSTIAQFGLKASDSGHVADVFTAAINKSRLQMDDLQIGMKYAGPVASSFGLSLSETTAALAEMADAGIEGSTAGTSLRAALSSLANPVGQAGDALKDMGLSAEQVNPQTHSLAEIMGTLKDAGLDTNDAINLFGSEAASAMLAVSKQGVPALQKLTTELQHSGGTAAQTAKMQRQTLAGAWDQLSGSAETLAIKLEQRMEPAIIAVMKAATRFVNWLGSLPRWAQAAVIAVAAIVAVLGPLILIGGLVATAISAVVTAVATLGGIAVVAAAVGAFIAVMVGLAAAALVVGKAWKPVKNFFVGLGHTIGQAMGAVKNAAISGWNAVTSAVKNALNQIRSVVLAVWRYFAPYIRQQMSVIQKTVSAAWNIIKKTTTAVWNGIKQFFGGVWKAIRALFSGNTQGVKKGVYEAWLGIKKITGAVWKGIGALLKVAWKGITALFGNALKFLVKIVGDAWNGIKKATAAIWKGIRTFFADTWKAIKELFSNSAKDTANNLKNQWEAIKSLTQTIWNAIKAFFKAIWNAIKVLFKLALEGLKKLVGDNWNAIKKLTSTVWDAIKKLTSAAWDAIKKAISDRIDQAKQNVNKTIDTLKKALSSAWDTIKKAADKAWEAIKDRIWQPIKNAYENVKQWIGKILDVINGVLKKVGLPAIGSSGGGGGGGGSTSGAGGGGGGGGGGGAFARGGIYRADRGGIAGPGRMGIVGEAGEDESIVNLERRTPESQMALRAAMRSPNATHRRNHRRNHRRSHGRSRGQSWGQPGAGWGEGAPISGTGSTGISPVTLHHWDPSITGRVHAIARATGTVPNTYPGHGEPGGSSAMFTADFWGKGGRGSPIPKAMGYKTADLALSKYNSNPPVLYIIRQGQYWRDGHWGGNTYGDPHYDHTHISWADDPGEGGGGAGTSGFNPMAALFDKLWSSLVQPIADHFIDPLLDDPFVVKNAVGTGATMMVDGIHDWIASKLGSSDGGSVGSSPKGLTADDVVRMGGWPSSKHKTAVGIMWEESGFIADNGNGTYEGLFAMGKPAMEEVGMSFSRVHEPVYNSTAANKLQAKLGWRPWTTYPPSADSMSRGSQKITGYDFGGLITRDHLAQVHANELILPLGNMAVARQVQIALGTGELKEELREMRRVIARGLKNIDFDKNGEQTILQGGHNAFHGNLASQAGRRALKDALSSRSFGAFSGTGKAL